MYLRNDCSLKRIGMKLMVRKNILLGKSTDADIGDKGLQNNHPHKHKAIQDRNSKTAPTT
jgi:hypothetical protein